MSSNKDKLYYIFQSEIPYHYQGYVTAGLSQPSIGISEVVFKKNQKIELLNLLVPQKTSNSGSSLDLDNYSKHLKTFKEISKKNSDMKIEFTTDYEVMWVPCHENTSISVNTPFTSLSVSVADKIINDFIKNRYYFDKNTRIWHLKKLFDVKGAVNTSRFVFRDKDKGVNIRLLSNPNPKLVNIQFSLSDHTNIIHRDNIKKLYDIFAPCDTLKATSWKLINFADIIYPGDSLNKSIFDYSTAKDFFVSHLRDNHYSTFITNKPPHETTTDYIYHISSKIIHVRKGKYLVTPSFFKFFKFSDFYATNTPHIIKGEILPITQIIKIILGVILHT